MTLKLIPGGAADDPAGGRTHAARRRGGRRRTVVRRTPPAGDPVTEVLAHLDEEPAVDRTRVPRWRTAALLLVFCAALAAAGTVGLGRYTDRAHRQATAAAERACVDFVSVSAASVDRDLQRILAGTTGDLRDGFSRGRAQARAAVVANDVDSRGTVLRAALLAGDRRHATVLVALDATVRTADAPDGRRTRYRIRVELVRTDGRWLVSRLRFLP